ncbi:MAG: hypothetical protein H0T69_06625 [Thermoleophilaceae bacterium]|nr:hypothetical protein [Thermoleophilaceae bacterium]
MSDTPLVATPLYGLRTWTVVGESGAERLAGPHQCTTWPPGGAWLEATCTQSPVHQPPTHGCGCGLHAWHPSRRSARRILAGRRDVPGIAEARGAMEVHEDGFRAERARPYALVLVPGRNARLVRRLAKVYAAQVVEADSPDAVLAFCRARGLGLDESTVVRLLGPATAAEYRRARRERVRADALRLAAAVAAVALLVVAGLRVATDPPGDRVLHGRTGEIHTNSR